LVVLEAAGHWRPSRTGCQLAAHAGIGAGRGGRRCLAEEVDVQGRPGIKEGGSRRSRGRRGTGRCARRPTCGLVPASEGSGAGPRWRPVRSRWVCGVRVGSGMCEWASAGVVYLLTFSGLWGKIAKIALTSGGPLGKNRRKFLNFRRTKVG
jgi:hypothetical protein